MNFIDITFDIIPKVFKPNKLMTIAALDKKNNQTILICFVILKFLGHISYHRTLKYLYENFEFNPLIIHTDFESSLAITIYNLKFYKHKKIHIKCFFHFVKAIIQKLHNLGLIKKNNFNNIGTIVNNIELLCFIDITKLDKYKTFIIKNIKEKYK